jgi:hypothetical protein
VRRLSPFLLCACISAAAWAGASVQPEELTRQVASNGAAAVVNRLFKDTGTWNAVMSHISSGDHRWVSLGITLLAGADAGAASEIHDALFPVLGRDPGYLLRKPPSPNFDAVEICGGRDDPLSTYKDAEAEQLSVRAKVAALGDGFGERRRLCLAALDSGLKDIRRYFGVQPK